ncbi:Pyridoxamine 5'-phosphate oxidase [Ekhidna lutea]|uniref:Pyridoxine/pyridoxamine 5'-phosphate oxidase n=1 Tax=Ekhidna lutea TaxID=447679 RepID=A0A239LDE4_EKHLU|nr:pyridoxamine 5'-phosphate oxidase [Ekhidna lutea]SNT28501.1 Pyridoxamine 5'-phosphate oxidase [Ekhidna lutea]
MREDIASLRNEYSKEELDEQSIEVNPFNQFDKWFTEAVASEILEPNAMVVSTVSKKGVPSQRTVLLKDADKEGYTFYTNYDSKKGQELEHNANISLLFPWYELERQVIITGKAQKVLKEKSVKYFHSRPRESQLGAWASNQSSEITDRSVLEEKLKMLEERFLNKEIPLPENWGGYLVIPETFEFWQGRKSRLHDRIFYQDEMEGTWKISRLSP